MTVSYPYERPDQKALTELEQVVHHLAEELAGWRRRTLKAEGELQQARANGGVLAGPELSQARQRIAELEAENQSLQQRIDSAKNRLQTLAGRLTFLEQHGGGNAA
jgi:chromosome segregation ATPase